MSQIETQTSCWLVPLAGPTLDAIELPAEKPALLIGRHEQCDIHLTSEQVSRRHAKLILVDGSWRLVDLQSRWGTFVNGYKIPAEREVPLHQGDLIRISPWTFTFKKALSRDEGISIDSDATDSKSLVRPLQPAAVRPMAATMLSLLLETASAMQQADSEQAMAEVLVDAACRASGLPNAAVLRPLDGRGRFEVITSRPDSPDQPMNFSRTLLDGASEGSVVVLSQEDSGPYSQSIAQLQIDTAICVPLKLGSAVAAYLYLDSRRSAAGMGQLHPEAAAFCRALGQMAGMALANFNRINLEKRQALIDAELAAGAEAQRWILPLRQGELGVVRYVGESRPGRYVGGDFFDVIALDERRVAVALGDVSGKGVPASVLMATAQGFLNSALREHGDIERAVAGLNSYLESRCHARKFITLWLAILDTRAGTLQYIDAGHGYALMIGGDGRIDQLNRGDSMPVGLDPDATYKAEAMTLPGHGRLLIFSDGIAEQPAPQSDGESGRRQFGINGVNGCLVRLQLPEDDLSPLFEAVVAHAGSTELADDATAVSVWW